MATKDMDVRCPHGSMDVGETAWARHVAVVDNLFADVRPSEFRSYDRGINAEVLQLVDAATGERREPIYVLPYRTTLSRVGQPASCELVPCPGFQCYYSQIDAFIYYRFAAKRKCKNAI